MTTPDERLAEATVTVDKARRARSLSVTEEDRERTWIDLNMAMANYNQCLREATPSVVSAGSGS